MQKLPQDPDNDYPGIITDKITETFTHRLRERPPREYSELFDLQRDYWRKD